jgi:hypothetical protein
MPRKKVATDQSERAASHNRSNALTRYREWKTFETLELAQRVAALYVQGQSIKQIANATGHHYEKIKYCLVKVREIWTKAAADDYDRHVAEELARIFTVETEAWDAWQKSKRDNQSVTEVDSEHPMTTKTRSRSNGDPRFLTVVQKCTEQRMKLLGLGTAPDDPNANKQSQIVEVVIHTRSEKEEFERIMPYSQFRQNQQPITIEGSAIQETE